jgi:hypothetical protein
MNLRLVTALLALPCLLRGADKDAYSLFHPTPRDEMREMSTDRPDTTESAYTVDAGHFQMETTLFGYAKDGGVESYSFGETNFKLGLTNRTDLQLVMPFYERQRGGDNDDSGIGDLTVRYKWNLWGNDGGETAFALMPFVKVPTASHDLGNNKVEGGLIVPLCVNLSEGVGLGLMAEFDIVRDDTGGGYGVDFVNSATVGFELIGSLGGYVEFVSVATTRDDATWEGYANAGVTFAVTDDFVFDAGVSVGVNSAAQDFAPFVGFSYRY